MVLPTHPPALGGIEEMKRPRGDMRACAVGDSPRRLPSRRHIESLLIH